MCVCVCVWLRLDLRACACVFVYYAMHWIKNFRRTGVRVGIFCVLSSARELRRRRQQQQRRRDDLHQAMNSRMLIEKHSHLAHYMFIN